MKIKWLYNALAVMFLVVGFLVGFTEEGGRVVVAAEGNAADKIEPALLNQFNLEGTADFVVHFVEQADLSPAYNMDWDSRGEYVYNTLKETAAHSQANAKNILRAGGFVYQTFIAGNKLYVEKGNIIIATKLAELADVSVIVATRVYHLDPVVEENPMGNIRWSGDLLSLGLNANIGSADASGTWSIADVKADQFWAAFGVQGEGIKVANIDTGVQWDHPALMNAYACKDDPSDPACWMDAYKVCGGEPCDDNGHGSHTMGTMVANDDPTLPYIAGVAPNATWIACKGCAYDTSCATRTLLSCADWILAPDDNSANRPNVVNNSWGGGSGDDWYVDEVVAWRAAGIFPAFSAGNNGPSCNTLGSPGDYQESFGSAAHDSVRFIATFSSRGPSAFGHEPYTKPNISAPGVSICSTIPDDAWTCGYSGTSMASPHTAGAVALLWSCNPDLVGDIDTTFQLLQNSADSPPEGTCGAPDDGEGNYTYGYGYLNILAAGDGICGEFDVGTVEGYVFDNFGNPVEGATVLPSVTIQSSGIETFTDPSGFYSIELVEGTYTLVASKVNYISEIQEDIEVIGGETTMVPDFTLEYLGSWIELDPLPGCPDWMRYDGEYFAGDGLIYFLGGRSGSTTDPSIYALDPNIGECVDTDVDMVLGVSNYTVVPLNIDGNDVLCTFGGRDPAGVNTNVVQCYDPVASTASQVTSLPNSMASYAPGGAVSVDNKAYIFGGLNLSKSPYAIAETWEWDPDTDTWTQLDDMSLAMGYLQMAVVDGLVYTFGGTTFDGANLTAQKAAYVLDPETGTWSALSELPVAGAEGRAYGFDSDSQYELAGKIVVAGGGIWPGETNVVYLYDIATDSYDGSIFDLNVTRREHAGVFVPGNPGRMWVFGGVTSDPGYGGDYPPYGPPEYLEVEIRGTDYAGVVLTPQTDSLSGDPGMVVEYTLSLENTGNVSDTFTIEASSVWLVNLPVASLDLGPGESSEVVVEVTVPEDALPGESDIAAVTATSSFDSAVFDTSELTTVANTVHAFELTPDSDAMTGEPGDIIIYNLTLTNLGNVMEAITLTYAGNEWEVHLPVTSLNLAVGVSIEVVIQVTIPSEAVGGDQDVVTITASAESGGEATSELTTSVMLEVDYVLSLPVVFK